MTAPKLVVFDVDGTLVDSQAEILDAMQAAFDSVGRAAPSRRDILGIVGLSLPQAIAALASDLRAQQHAAMVSAYKDRFADQRRRGAPPVLYPGMRALIDACAASEALQLGIATGKSRRGLDALLDGLGLRSSFATLQCADDHPSKPHPAMLEAALGEAGVDAGCAVMVGDTRFDIDMAQAAGLPAIAVSWGYHGRDMLGDAVALVDDAPALASAIGACLKVRL